MGIRPKLLLIILCLGVGLLAALSLVNYLNSLSVVESELRGEIGHDALAITRHIESRLREREDALVTLAQSPALRNYLQSVSQAQATTTIELPKELETEVSAALENNRKYYAGIACLGTDQKPLFRAELNFKATPSVIFQMRDFLSDSVKADERVWTASEQSPLESIITRESYGSILRYTIPVFIDQMDASAPRGALIIDYRLDTLLNDSVNAGDYQSTPASEFSATPRLVVMLDRAGIVVYHTNAALKYQPIAQAMPQTFAPITNAMKEGQAGWRFYDSTEGHRWLVVYQPIKALDLSVAVAGDYSAAVRGLRFIGWTSVGLTTLIGALMAALLWISWRRTSRQIVHVTEGTAALARGELDQPIEVRSSDETHLLAETINAVKERLREQLAREAEMRQFDSFMRLSAMLTHDLKNSILTLSLIVSNMKEQFQNEEFRADAMKSLTEATDKMRAMVAKLSEPVRSLSGEFKRPRPIDLVPVIKRVLARTVEPPTQATHEVVVHLPETLMALADDERIEKVLENLVLNAIEAMGAKGGKLTVEAGNAEEGFVFFSVADTGHGMSEEFQKTRLFRPFSTTKPKGIGLGLYASRELIRALGGRIEVESERDSGTTFRVVLPSGRIEGKG